MDNVVAFIPVRGGSKSIPHKNIRLINGRPLVYWVLDAAVGCNRVDKVYVSTDDSAIENIIRKYGSPKVEVVGRSAETATDTASTETAMLEFANRTMFDTIILLQATSPLTTERDIATSLEVYGQDDIDSVLSVVRQKRFMWESNGNVLRPTNYDYLQRPRRQEFEGYLVENGAIYITSRAALLNSGCRISGSIGWIEMPEETYFELDELSDWLIIEQMLKNRNNNSFPEKLKKIKMLLTDCDGVLTDGGMYYSENGDELKKYNTRDGMGVQLLRDKNIQVGIITGETRELVRRRAEKLKIDELYMGVADKCQVLEEIICKHKLQYSEVAYLGDDINDLGIMRQVGFACSVSDGMESVKAIADYITKAKGGEGALREVAELILLAK